MAGEQTPAKVVALEPLTPMPGTWAARLPLLLTVGLFLAVFAASSLGIEAARYVAPATGTVGLATLLAALHRGGALGWARALQVGLLPVATIVGTAVLDPGFLPSIVLVSGSILAGLLAIRLFTPRSFVAAGKLFRSQRFEEALQALAEAKRVDPGSYQPWQLEAAIHLFRGAPELAEPAAREAVRRAPKAFATHNVLGLASVGAGKDEEAVAAFEEALRLSPSLALNHFNLGLALVRAGRPAAALSPLGVAARAGMTLPRNNLLLHHFHRKAFLATGDAAGAAASLQAMRRHTAGIPALEADIAAAPASPGNVKLAADLAELRAALDGEEREALGGSACARHPDRPAILACPRCGTFACGSCTVEVAGARSCVSCEGRVTLDPIPWERDDRRLFPAFFRTAWQLSRHPAKAFPRVPKDGPLRRALSFGMLCTVAGTWSFPVFVSLVSTFSGGESGMPLGISLLTALFAAAVSAAISLLQAFFLASVEQLALRALGSGRAGYTGTLRAFFYGQAPGLVGILPVLGSCMPLVPFHPIAIWQMVCRIEGYRALHGAKKWQAVVAVVVPSLLMWAGLMLLLLGQGEGYDALM